MKKVVCNNCNMCGEKQGFIAKKKYLKSNKLYIFYLIVLLIIVLFIMFFCFSRVKQKDSVIKTSEIKELCSSLDKCILKENISKKLISLFNYEIKGDILYKGTEHKYNISVHQFGINKKFTFNIEDDLAPEILTDEIVLYYSEEINYNDQVNIIDYVDGKIDLTSNNVKIDVSDVNINAEGNYLIKIEVKDNNGNINKKEIKTVVKKRTPSKIKLNLQKEYYVDDEIKLNATIEPENVYDKNVNWYVDQKPISGDKYIPSKVGEYKLCAVSVMDINIYQCEKIKVKLACKSKYEFSLDGGTSAEFSVGQDGDVCSGTYKIYVNAINASTFANVIIHYPMGDYDMIFPSNQSYSNSGDMFVLNEGTLIEADSGITKIRLIKSN